jgi:hypothetical protein
MQNQRLKLIQKHASSHWYDTFQVNDYQGREWLKLYFPCNPRTGDEDSSRESDVSQDSSSSDSDSESGNLDIDNHYPDSDDKDDNRTQPYMSPRDPTPEDSDRERSRLASLYEPGDNLSDIYSPYESPDDRGSPDSMEL